MCGPSSTAEPFLFLIIPEPLAFNLEYYTEVQDLEYLAGSLDKETAGGKYAKLNHVICQLVEEYGLVGFETLAVEVSEHKAARMASLDTRIPC